MTCKCRIVGPIKAISKHLAAYRDIGDETYAIDFCRMHARAERTAGFVASYVELSTDLVAKLKELDAEADEILKEVTP